ncbi:MAG: type II toxin-antitoxin system mRNA interferase toxin, RelE/StbE family [Elusimicrobia bacterium HGW-Elusimicrobia-1]|jgi:addiction module RelE/StbE family toxin|nr:MAG: type II toxin-antitoxin system mRNA interferase toxin, RelE/StbE family [Elusimicrobia bacterium HGW-Elusimicrobia-1]
MPNVEIKKIHFAPRFFKSFKKLPPHIQILAKKKDALFRLNPFASQLQAHKLKGSLSGVWSYSVNYQYRLLFRFIKSDEVLYYDIGTHEVY